MTMNNTFFVEYILGAKDIYYRSLLIVVSTVVYTLFLRKKLKISIIFGAPVSFFAALLFPVILTVPAYVVLRLAYRGLKALFKSIPIAKTDTVPKAKDEDFSFRVDNRTILLENPYRGIYIQGGAGSGKSASLVYPILQQAVTKHYSGICYDFKSPELSSFLFRQMDKLQSPIKPYFVDFKDVKRSARVNPLEPDLMTKTAYAHEYAQTLMYNLSPNNIKNEDYWVMEAKSVLTGLIWYLKLEYPRYCSLPHLISLVLHSDVGELVKKVSENFEAADYVASLHQAIKNESNRQISGVVSTLQTNLAKLNSPDIFWILSGNDFDLDINSPSNPKFVCIGNESSLSQTYAPVISLILSVALKWTYYI